MYSSKDTNPRKKIPSPMVEGVGDVTREVSSFVIYWIVGTRMETKKICFRIENIDVVGSLCYYNLMEFFLWFFSRYEM